MMDSKRSGGRQSGHWAIARSERNQLATLALAALLISLSSPAMAQFMKPGPSPEAGVAGLWRVIGAQSAPWANKRKASNTGFPFLEQAVEFSDKTVKGAGSLACKDARFSSGVTANGDLFGGRLGDAENAAKDVNLTGSSITTYRVVCNDVPRDYYVDDNANLIMSEGDVIYTLERPTGMDPNQYAAGFSGPGFDCAKTKTAGEQMICRDAALSKADKKLNEAYRRLKATETPESFATVQAAQRAWLAHVSKSCGASGSMPEDLGERNALQECLDESFSDRAERLDSAMVFKAGALVLEPRMRLLTRTKPDTEESDIYPWMSGSAEALAFNAHVKKTLELDKRRMDDKDLFPFGDEVADMKLTARRTYSVTRFDSRVVSLQVSTYDYTGGAHEALAEKSLNWDVARAKPLSLDDVFERGKPWRKFVTDFCLRDLHDEFAGQEAPDPDRSAVERVVADGGNWLWGTDKATVHFTVYAVASFSGGEFDVDIPYDALKPYLRPDAPPLSRP
jgi:uncharacterized protein YecT (DUF1311 family)